MGDTGSLVIGTLISILAIQFNELNIDQTQAYAVQAAPALSFWGCVGIQSVMFNGTPDEVTVKVRETNELFGKNGGFLVAPAHILDPAIPWENIEAFIDAANELLHI